MENMKSTGSGPSRTRPQLILSAGVRLILCFAVIIALKSDVGISQTVQPGPFNILVLGDSVMWGQGLKDEHKFSTKVRDWICAQKHGLDQCDKPGDVLIHVEAHSGAVISRPDKSKELKEENRFIRIESPIVYPGEVNYAYPTIWGQIDLAKRYYETNKVPLTDVKLILVNGGINDMGATKILLPAVGGNIAAQADKYCGDQMLILLNRLAVTFPNARIIIPGYFPLVSEKTPWNILWESIGYLFLNKKDVNDGSIEEKPDLEVPSGPQSEKQHQILKLLATRSTQWVEASNAAFTNAAERFNAAHPIVNNAGARRAIFVPVQFGDQNAYAAPQTFLWRLVRKPAATTFACTTKDPLKNLIVQDEVQSERPCMCDKAGRGESISCLRAGAFHPNKEGAERYFAAIKTELESIWKPTGW